MKKFLHLLILSCLLAVSFTFTCYSDEFSPPFPKPVPIFSGDVAKYLDVSVVILDHASQESNWMGSGSIIYQKDGYAYVLSCDHIFKDKDRKKCGIEILFKDNKPLKQALFYDGEIIGMNSSYDLSFIKFKIDYDIQYYRIAPLDFKIDKDTELISTGCDQNITKMAAYKTFFWGSQLRYLNISNGYYIDARNSIVTYRSGGARHGRSGGGIFYDNYCLGVCSRGTEIVSGTGWTFYIHFQEIHEYAKSLGLDFLLKPKSKLWNGSTVETEDGVKHKAEEYLN